MGVKLEGKTALGHVSVTCLSRVVFVDISASRLRAARVLYYILGPLLSHQNCGNVLLLLRHSGHSTVVFRNSSLINWILALKCWIYFISIPRLVINIAVLMYLSHCEPYLFLFLSLAWPAVAGTDFVKLSGICLYNWIIKAQNRFMSWRSITRLGSTKTF